MTKHSGSSIDTTRATVPRDAGSPGRWALAMFLLATFSGGCASVCPEQRAILADPTMQHDDESLEAEARRHVLENREGAFGGGSVRGGGCGCN